LANNLIQKATAQAAVKQESGKTTMQAYIRQMEGEIRKALPAVMTPERFTRIILSALSSNPSLAQTTPQSFLGATMTAAQLGVEPNTPLGQAYLIPFRNKGILECKKRKVLSRNTPSKGRCDSFQKRRLLERITQRRNEG
jgi:recombination protein RecT